MSEWTDAQILDIGKFVMALVGLKEFKHGMETGKLTDFTHRYLTLFVKEFAKNPEAPILMGLVALGLWEDRDNMDLKVKVVKAIAPMVAYKLMVSGSNLAFGTGAAYLSLFGMGFLMGGITPEDAVGSAQDWVVDNFGDPDIPEPIVVGEIKWLGIVTVKCPVDGMIFKGPTLVGVYKDYYAHYRVEHLEVEG